MINNETNKYFKLDNEMKEVQLSEFQFNILIWLYAHYYVRLASRLYVLWDKVYSIVIQAMWEP